MLARKKMEGVEELEDAQVPAEATRVRKRVRVVSPGPSSGSGSAAAAAGFGSAGAATKGGAEGDTPLSVRGSFCFFRGSPLSCFCPSLCPGLTAARNPAVNGLCLFPYHTLKFLNASVCMCWIASWWRCARPMSVGNLHFAGCLAAWPLVHPLPRACGCACSCAQDFAKYFIVWCVLGPVCPTVRSPAPVCVSQIGGPSPITATSFLA